MTSAERPRLKGQALRLLPFFLLVFVGLSVYRLSRPAAGGTSEESTAQQTISGSTMGTTFNVKVVGRLSAREAKEATEAIHRALASVDEAMSTYKPESELSRFNASVAVDTPFTVSPALREVLTIALRVGQQSGGALDITVGPLVNAWGFGPSARGVSPPSPETIAALRDQVGLDKLELRNEGLIKKRPFVQCDLSAVAKGYAVDKVAEALIALHLTDFLVEVGGELKAHGVRSDGTPFRVGIEKPLDHERGLERVVLLGAHGMATSGDYRNFFDDHGKRRSHFLDARTGKPVEHNLASVTVLSEDTATADAWATALSVLGPDVGPMVAERHGLAAFFIVRDGANGFRSTETEAFRQTQSSVSP